VQMIGFREAVAVSFLVLGIIRDFRFKSQIPCRFRWKRISREFTLPTPSMPSTCP